MKQVSIFFAVLFSTIAQSQTLGVVEAKARCLDQGFSVYNYDYIVDYKNPQIPATSKVEVLTGFAGTGSVNSGPARGSFHWDLKSYSPSKVQHNGVFRAQTKLSYMLTGGYYSHLEFIFKITLPNGKVIWDNGQPNGSAWNEKNYYSALFFNDKTVGCWHLRNGADLAITKITTGFRRR